ncbi:carboxylesterase family protein [Nocardia terpenica]|uniref:Carboxylesterase family protein n=1 Tax=Nocardia terpenica TaxID=455432 RepID=A0A6G9ZG02_9NOCA|nr:carboxylesterase family protein [Nocardia terpenica]
MPRRTRPHRHRRAVPAPRRRPRLPPPPRLTHSNPPAAHRGSPLGRRFDGGRLYFGPGDTYRARRLATRGHVVVVTLNHRLGALGYLAHPALDTPRRPDDVTWSAGSPPHGLGAGQWCTVDQNGQWCSVARSVGWMAVGDNDSTSVGCW